MSEQRLTYGRLDEALRSVGFTSRTLEGKARIYKHPSGATVILPDSPLDDTVIPHHLVVVRTVLAEYDLPDPMILASKPQPAS
jgi:predicted RNA binding protein YcfA (HicA-like mRNA interferase family)